MVDRYRGVCQTVLVAQWASLGGRLRATGAAANDRYTLRRFTCAGHQSFYFVLRIPETHLHTCELGWQPGYVAFYLMSFGFWRRSGDHPGNPPKSDMQEIRIKFFLIRITSSFSIGTGPRNGRFGVRQTAWQCKYSADRTVEGSGLHTYD